MADLIIKLVCQKTPQRTVVYRVMCSQQRLDERCYTCKKRYCCLKVSRNDFSRSVFSSCCLLNSCHNSCSCRSRACEDSRMASRMIVVFDFFLAFPFPFCCRPLERTVKQLRTMNIPSKHKHDLQQINCDFLSITSQCCTRSVVTLFILTPLMKTTEHSTLNGYVDRCDL